MRVPASQFVNVRRLGRVLRVLVMVLCGLACLALVCTIAASSRWRFSWECMAYYSNSIDGGAIELGRYGVDKDRLSGWTNGVWLRRPSYTAFWKAERPFMWSLRPKVSRGGFWTTVRVPLWPLLLPPALVGIVVWRVRPRRRLGLCQNCGYDRSGLAVDAACPECGSPTRSPP